MHQAPAAFGFVSFLLHVGRPAREIIVQLTLISAAAPTTALISAAALEQGSPDADGSQGWLGLCLLFAAGSFLYVATVHVLPEVLNGKRLGRSGLAALVVGILAPITLSGAHSH
jgi:zinc transporter 9